MNENIKFVFLCFYRTEEKARKMEKTIVDLVDESCLAYEKNDTKLVKKKGSFFYL
jgi:hypothetical protein